MSHHLVRRSSEVAPKGMCRQLFSALVTLSACVSALLSSASAETLTTCGNLSRSTNRTACPEFFSCCRYGWSESEGSWGCAPFPDAVCCPSKYYACPSGHTCQEKGEQPPWKDEVVCLPPADAQDAPIRKAEEICKNGPPVLMDEHRKNVIIIGDSVSIGYTPLVAESLKDIAQIVHSPWDYHDGGASDAGYGYRCLSRLLTAADGTPLRPDVLYFNWGIHSAVPGSDEAHNYAKYLSWIVQELTAWARSSSSDDEDPVKLMFALTSPWLNDKDKDDVINEHNTQAKKLMDMYGIPTVDLHDPIITKCGEPPQASCFNKTECWSPHCKGAGYEWLAETTVTPAIRALLLGGEEAVGDDEISLAIE